ncbi:bifunctional protein GlmU-like isoform X2 [Littorina saxatilis]|uniref:PPC domain-containing protein n=1 Tax=Littorina saxatilis TaxID=31220 RepID=A0AAN9GDA7_9CAEN
MFSCQFQKAAQMGSMRCIPVRFKPAQELRQSLLDMVKSLNLKAAFVVTCVGSVTKATLRMADSSSIVTFEGPFEIVSLVGTLSGGEGGHLHISLSDSKGKVIGGHVVGNLIVHTTAEVVVGECEGVRFEREDDKETGYEELVVYAK